MVASNPFALPLKQQMLGGFDYDVIVKAAGIPPDLQQALVRFMRAVDEEKHHTLTTQGDALEQWAFGSLQLTEVQAPTEPAELGQIEAKLLHVLSTTDTNGWVTVTFEKPFSTALLGAVVIWAEGAALNHMVPSLGSGTPSTIDYIHFRMFTAAGAAVATPTACRFCALVFGW